MAKTPPPARGSVRRILASASVVVALSATLAAAGSCNDLPQGSSEGALTGGTPTDSGSTGPGGSAPLGNGSTSNSVGVNPGVMVTPGVAVLPGGSNGPGVAPPAATPAGLGNGGNLGNGGSGPAGPLTPVTPGNGGQGSTAEPCVDVEPPPDPEWPDATCATWANETTECSAAWFADYCDASCGRCVPEGGLGNGGQGNVPEPCEDVLPPPDPEWPDATCMTWATETTECSADWFAEYCDVSCGRCVPEGGLGAGGMSSVPEPEPCEDILPPPDPEWPDATCGTWATETTECGADWFANYCDISCGRCIPEGGLPPVPTAPDCSGEGLPNVTGGEGFATRYWDCCQPHCAQFDGHRCGQDGVSNTGDGNSACSGGGAYACYDGAPREVSECLSYGHIAKSNPNCGGCYRIQFTGQGEHNANDPGSKLIAGKQMIVKVSNTGGDVAGTQFDLMIPGGGVGQFNACSRQWGTDDLGAQYGGFLTDCSGSHEEKKECVRQECMKIPEGAARDGCIWFVDWFQVADNPKFTSQATDCPF